MNQEVTATPIAEYRPTEAALADLRARYDAVVYDVTTSKGMTEAKKARAELRDLRVSLERTRKEIKEPALTRCRQIDSEAKRITGALESLEEPIDAQIKREEQRKEDERRQREEAERQRVAAIHSRIAAFNEDAGKVIGQPAVVIKAKIDRLRAIQVTAEAFAELIEQAEEAKAAALASMESQLERQQEHEAEQERIRAERAELEELRRREQERQAADAAAAAEERRIADEAAAAERHRLDEAARVQREAEEQRLAAEPVEVERVQAEQLAQQRAEMDRERREEEQRLAAEREQLRKDQEAAARERARLEAEALANVTVYDAAQSALDWFNENGYGQIQPARMLHAALSRDEAIAA